MGRDEEPALKERLLPMSPPHISIVSEGDQIIWIFRSGSGRERWLRRRSRPLLAEGERPARVWGVEAGQMGVAAAGAL